MMPFPGGFGGGHMPMMMGGGGFGQMPFEEKYHVCSVALKSQELEEGGRIVLPPSALAKLTQRDVAYPYFFELSAPGNGRKIHCGVQEFSASEGQAWIPHWMMENLGVEFGNLLTVKSVTLPQCQYVKFRPQSKLFLDITNPKAVLAKTLGAFSALTKGATIRIHYNRKTYDIDVVDLKPRDTGAASIVNADVNVDFEAPSDYVEPTYTPKPIKMEVDSIAGARQAGGGASQGERPRILAFFAQPRADALNTKGESQNLSKSMLQPHYFEFDAHAQPQFTDFQESLMCSAARNTRLVHLAGHADQQGFHFAKDEDGLETEPIEPENITDLLVQASAAHGGTVECVVLNACSTEDMGRRLRAEGVKHVVCWRGKVLDGAALEFSKTFYKSLQLGAGHGCTSIPPRAYTAAFKHACVALRVWKGRQGADRGRKSVENAKKVTEAGVTAQVVLLLSEDGEEECRCAEQAAGEGGGAGGAAASEEL